MRFIMSGFLGFCAAAAVSLATGTAASAASGRLTIELGGVKRTAFIVEHARLKRARRPVIVVLHGQAGLGVRVRRYLGIESALRSQSVVTVYPDAIAGHWDVSETGGDRDLKFIHDLIARLEADGVADPRRVYIVGSATGGIVAMRLACRDAGSFAGAASLISLMPASDAAACKPSRPIPFFLLAGTADPKVPFNGGKAGLIEYKGDVVSAQATLAPFVAAAGCSDKSNVVEAPDRDKNDGSRVQIEFPAGCKALIELVKVDGGGHTLPGHRRALDRGLAVGAHNGDVDTARLIVDFLRRARGG